MSAIKFQSRAACLSGVLWMVLWGSALSDERDVQSNGKSRAFFAGPDPDSLSALFELLRDKQIQEELKLTEVEVTATMRISDGYKETMRVYLDEVRTTARPLDQSVYKQIRDERRQAAEDAIEEILTPDHLRRLRQLAFRVEVSNIGLPASLVLGRLRGEAGVYDNQRHSILTKGNAIVERARQESENIWRKAEADVLAQLAPEQRKKAEEALGEYFYYEVFSQAQKVRELSAPLLENNR